MKSRASWLSLATFVVAVGMAVARLAATGNEIGPRISDAQWIWDDGMPHPVNYFLMFRKGFVLPGTPRAAMLHVTASDRYVLYVNGQYVGRGPARSDPRFKSYDTHQLLGRLQPGKNVIAVLAYHYGQNTNPNGPYLGNSYAAGDRAGLWAKAEIRLGDKTIVVPTGPEWRVKPAEGWRRDVPPINPLVGFPEWYDARRDPVNWAAPGFDDASWSTATLIPPRQQPWRSLEPRGVPLMRERDIFPTRIAKTGEVFQIAGDDVHGRFMKEGHLPLEVAKLERPESLLARGGSNCRAQATMGPDGQVHEPFIILDFGRQVFGFPTIRVDTSAGAVVDMIASPHLDKQRIATGAMRLGSRYIAREGRQTWQQFEYSQFRYLQIAVRSRQPVAIESISLVAYEYPAERRGRFECSDPTLTRLWKACVDTAYLQMEDVVAIDAWRERVNWTACDILDGILAGFGDTAVVRRHFRLISRVDLGDGVIPIFYPPAGRIPRIILQGNMIWITQVESYYQQTGDREFLAEHWPACKRQIDWFDRIVDRDGLITDMPMWNWFDWSAMDIRGTCFANNAVYLKSLESAAAMAELMNDSSSARRWRDKATRIRGLLRSRFWNPQRGLFEDAYVNGKFTGRFSEMANGLALWCKIAADEQVSKIVEQFQAQTPPGIARPTPIHFRFILWGLSQANRLDKALELTAGRYGPMLAATDAPTIWELWTQSPGGTRSLTHGGNEPALLLSQQVLGIKSVGSGFRECRIEVPDLKTIHWAKGVLPSARGDIGVDWRREGQQLSIDVELPAEMKTTLALGRAAQGHSITLDGKPVLAADVCVVGGKHRVTAR